MSYKHFDAFLGKLIEEPSTIALFCLFLSLSHAIYIVEMSYK